MGAWGAGSFENDAAMDWIADISTLQDIEAKFDELSILDDDETSDGSPFIDADLASEVVAAAEIVAALMDRIALDVPEELQASLQKLGKAEPSLIDKAKIAVSRILTDSELLELWSENEDDPNEWNIAITGLIDRLNADVPYDRPSKAEVEEIAGELTPCVFCGKGILQHELSSITFQDLSSKNALFMSRGLYCHLSCLNGKIHPKHLIQNWKFNVDDAEVDRIINGDID